MQAAGYKNLYVQTCTNCQTSMISGDYQEKRRGAHLLVTTLRLCVLMSYLHWWNQYLCTLRLDPSISACCCTWIQNI